jgi:hypothetical protein
MYEDFEDAFDEAFGIDSESSFLLTEDQQRAIIATVLEAEAKGRRARQEKEETWQKCWRAYHNYVDKSLYKKQPWRSKLHLPWTFQAVEAGATELQDLLLPNDEEFFAVQPLTAEDQPNAQAMTRYLQYLFRRMGFSGTFSTFLKQLCITGNSVLKVYWKEDKRLVLHRQPDPMGGDPLALTLEDVVYDAPYVENIDLQDFVFYPVTGSLDRAMCIHRIVKTLEEVQENPIYQNTTAIKAQAERDVSGWGLGIESEARSVFGIHDHPETRHGVELLEAWGDFVIAGQVFKNHVATVANGNTLIRFQPNPYEYGVKPFVFATLIPVPGQIYGIGLVEPSLCIQSMANTISNILLDEMKLKLNGQWKYEEDGVFNPSQFVSRPGGTVKVGSLNNLVPLNPNLNLDVGFAELNALKAEFEETTGVNKYSKGAESLSKSRTASEALMLQEAGSRKFTRIAKHLNDSALTRTIELVYLLVRQFGNPAEIGRVVQAPQEAINLSIPLSQLDFKITGLQTSLLKQQNIQNTERFVSAMAATPAAPYLKWDVLTQRYYKLLGFENAEEIMLEESVIEILRQARLMDVFRQSPDAL